MDNYSREAERALLGLLLNDHSRWFKVIELVSDIDFSDDGDCSHRLVFHGIEKTILYYGMSDEVNMTSVLDMMIRDGFDRHIISNLIYQLACSSCILGNQNPLAYANIIKEKAVMRELVSRANDTTPPIYTYKTAKVKDLEMKVEERDIEIKYKDEVIGELIAALHKSECG